MGREDARISSFFFKNICRWFKLRSLFRAFNQADFVKSASRAVSMLLCCHMTQQLPWRLSAVSGLSISWTCIWQVKFVSLGKELWGFLFFFLSSWRNFLGSCPLLPPPPSPFPTGKDFSTLWSWVGERLFYFLWWSVESARKLGNLHRWLTSTKQNLSNSLDT